MTPFELHTLAVKRFGENDWLKKLAHETGVNERTVRRWWNGEAPITERVAGHVRLVCESPAPARGVSR